MHAHTNEVQHTPFAEGICCVCLGCVHVWERVCVVCGFLYWGRVCVLLCVFLGCVHFWVCAVLGVRCVWSVCLCLYFGVCVCFWGCMSVHTHPDTTHTPEINAPKNAHTPKHIHTQQTLTFNEWGELYIRVCIVVCVCC